MAVANPAVFSGNFFATFEKILFDVEIGSNPKFYGLAAKELCAFAYSPLPQALKTKRGGGNQNRLAQQDFAAAS